jgi:hypothetical protein
MFCFISAIHPVGAPEQCFGNCSYFGMDAKCKAARAPDVSITNILFAGHTGVYAATHTFHIQEGAVSNAVGTGNACEPDPPVV